MKKAVGIQPNHVLGSGWNSLNGEATGGQLVEFSPEAIQKSLDPRTKFDESLISTTRDVQRTLEVDGCLALRSLSGCSGFGVEAYGKYFKELKDANKNIVFVVRCEVRTSSQFVNVPDIRVREAVADQLMSPDFQHRFGDGYISCHHYGGEMVASVEIICNDSSEREKIIAGGKLNIGWIEGQGKFSKEFKEAFQKYEKRVVVNCIGGDIKSVPVDIPGIEALAQDFPGKVAAAPALLFGTVTTYFAALGPRNELMAKANEQLIRNEMLVNNDLSERYHLWCALQQQINEFLNSNNTTDFWIDRLATLLKEISKNKRNITDLWRKMATSASYHYDQEEIDSWEVPSIFSHKNRLPKLVNWDVIRTCKVRQCADQNRVPLKRVCSKCVQELEFAGNDYIVTCKICKQRTCMNCLRSDSELNSYHPHGSCDRSLAPRQTLVNLVPELIEPNPIPY